MKLLYLGSHAILEYDQVKLWTELGIDVYSIGAYSDPRNPAVDLRPAIDAPAHPELDVLCHEQRVRHTEPAGYPIIDWAKADLHHGLIDWADVILVDCYPESWIAMNWPRIREKRVIWRTIGQSGEQTERTMRHLHSEGLEIVRYSPAEKRAYHPAWFAGEDALIRFGKDPADWHGWTGDGGFVGHLAQHDPVPHGRADFLNWPFFEAATEGLPVKFAGPNSELIGGLGSLTYDEMRTFLRECRVYLYTGTLPASYTLALIEAMMTGVPVVSIGPKAWGGRFGMADLFEGHEIVDGDMKADDDPAYLNKLMRRWYVDDRPEAVGIPTEDSAWGRARAIELFGTATVGRQWADFLGVPQVEFSMARGSVTNAWPVTLRPSNAWPG